MLKRTIMALCLVVIPILAAGCSPGVSPGQEFTLTVGKSVAIKGEDMIVKFVGVTSESRSPKGVQTIRAGEATIQLEITRGGTTSNVTITEIGNTNGFTRTFFDKYSIDSQLLPYPEVNNPQPKQSEYKLLMKIDTANTTVNPAPGPSGVPVVDNGAIIKGEVKSVTSLSSRPVWAIEIMVQSVHNLNNLPNMAAGKEGQILVVLTPLDISDIKAGQIVTATVKLSGDEFGTSFYASNITR